MNDPYKALGISQKATDAEIKKAYRKLAKEYHPDRTGGDKNKESRFKEISVAYDILSDPDKRAQYDAMRSGGRIPGGAMDLGDLFAQIFGDQGGRARGGNARGGGFPGGMGGGFPGGMGGGFPGGMGGGFPGGMGGGFPGGMGGGFPGGAQRAGGRAPRNEAPTEHKIRAKDGSALLQRGANVYSDLRIPFDQALLGTVATVPTLSGTAKVKIPPGTSSGKKLRLTGKGARLSSGSGDHFVTIQIDVPKVERDDSRELVAKLVASLAKS